jgi:hypothetical protein
MVEIGTSGTPWRAASMAAGAALTAESEGSHAFWLPDLAADGLGLSDAEWARLAGVMARLVPDPTDVADPMLTAVVALMVTRRMRVGVLGWEPGGDAARAARTVAALADIAAGRAIVACSGPEDGIAGLARARRPDLDVELATVGADPELAARLGWSWIGTGMSAAALVKAAHDAGVTESIGIHLGVCAHPDPAVVRRCVDAPLLRAMGFDATAEGVVVGSGTDLDAAIDEYVAAGVSRIILDDLMPFGAPEQLEASQSVVRGSIRSARLRHRSVG